MQSQRSRGQYKNTINNNLGNESPLDPSYPTTAGPEYSNKAEAEGKHYKSICMKTIEFLKEGINKSLKEIQEKSSQVR